MTRYLSLLTFSVALVSDYLFLNLQLDGRPEWHLPLSGLINVMATIKKIESSSTTKTDPNSNEHVIVDLRASYPRIVTVIWQDRANVVDQEVVSLLALALYHFSRLADIQM